jgi:drug/metabolite transporter (DMT)-like permease
VAHLAFAFCCICWGSTFILLERVTHSLGAVEIGIWRLFSGAAAVAAVAWLRGHSLRLSGRDLFWLTFVAVIFTMPPQIIQAYALRHGLGHGFLGTLVAGIPLLTILVSVPMLGIRPSSRELLGVSGGLVCMGLILDDGVGRGVSLAILALTALVPISSALSNTVIKRTLPHVPAAPLTAWLLALSALSMLPLQFSPTALNALDLAGPASGSVTATTLLYMFLLGVVFSGLSTMAFTWMILERGPLFAGMATYVVPLIALAWGALDHEAISTQQTAAIAGVLAMVAMVQSGSRKSVEIVAADVGASLAVGEGFVSPMSIADVESSLRQARLPEHVAAESLAS